MKPTVQEKLHLRAAQSSLYRLPDGSFMINQSSSKAPGKGMHSRRRAQIAVVEALLVKGWIEELPNDQYAITATGQAALDADSPSGACGHCGYPVAIRSDRSAYGHKERRVRAGVDGAEVYVADNQCPGSGQTTDPLEQL